MPIWKELQRKAVDQFFHAQALLRKRRGSDYFLFFRRPCMDRRSRTRICSRGGRSSRKSSASLPENSPPASSMGKSTTPYSFPRIFFCVRECCTLPRIRSPISACAFTNESRPSSVGNPVRRGAATSISRTPIRKWWTATWAFLKK